MPMLTESSKVMFEIYREAGDDGKYRAVYFTELEEHNKEAEIARAMAGEHVYDGFLVDARLADGKQAVAALLDRLNDGEQLTADQISAALTGLEAE
jgi:hypothetical protein